MRSLKQILQDNMLKKADAEYEQNLNIKKNTYKALLRELEPQEAESSDGETGSRPVWQTVTEQFVTVDSVNCPAGFTVFASEKGRLRSDALDEYVKAMEDPEVMIVYGDEDIIRDGDRAEPNFKPDYSPNLLLAYPYMGNGVALRQSLINRVVEEMSFCSDGEVNLYDLLLRAVESLKPSQICHISRFVYTGEDVIRPVPGSEKRFLKARVDAMKRRGHDCEVVTDKFGSYQLVPKLFEHTQEKPLVSVIIPSRDHPELIKACIESLYEKNKNISFEVIVVDNGSVGANRARIANLRNELTFRYYYEPGEFHFARICNWAAERAEGQYLLFLNDDTKFISDNALLTLCGQASMEQVGSVGAKLYYEDGSTIQHAGIINTEVGPIHVLMGETDDKSLCFGRNVVTYDCLAMTGACVMIRTELFRKIGGFDEAFGISYNDVDLGFRLWKMGYGNVIRNDVELIHFESMSRGADAEDEKKWERLFRERSLLFEKHKELYHRDPYFSRHLNAELPGVPVRKPADREIVWQECLHLPEYIAKYTNEALKVQIDQAGYDARASLTDSASGTKIVGWWYVLGQDNARYRMKMVLLNENNSTHFACELDGIFREDVAAALECEKNVSLGGFHVRIPMGTLPAGRYRIGLMGKDKCSRQQLVRMTNECIELR